jgi:hypothetical protein
MLTSQSMSKFAKHSNRNIQAQIREADALEQARFASANPLTNIAR